MRQTEISASELIVRLLDVLGGLGQRAQSLIELLQRERQAIKTFALDELPSINEAKLRLLEELAGYEGRRTDVIAQLSEVWDMPTNAMTIGGIAARAGGPVADQLMQRQAQLNRTILSARRSNDVTGALLHTSLAFLHEAVAIVRAPFQVQLPLYSESGSMQTTAPGGGLLLRKG